MGSVTNLTGSNAGPNSSTTPDQIWMEIGNIWKIGNFSISITPTALGSGPAIAEQTYSATGIGLVTTDVVFVTYSGAQTANVALGSARVSAADTLAITWSNSTGTPTPASGTYVVTVVRTQPNWTKPSSGNQLDW